ncbi:MAG: hypothetical protein V1685_04210 [Parcubacteria group bacterium]
MNPTLLLKITYFLVLFVNSLVGGIVLLKNFKKATNLTFFVLIVILNGWVISDYLTYMGKAGTAQLGAHLSYVFGTLIVPTFMLFVYYFPQQSKFRIKGYLLALVLPILVFAYFSFSPAFVKEMVIVKPGPNQLITGEYAWVYSVFIISFVAAFLFLVAKKIVNEDPIGRIKLWYVLAGFIAASTIGVFFDLILQPILIKSSVGVVGSSGTVFISLAVGYAIIRYRFLDISIAIRKGIIQLMVFTVLLGFYAYVITFLQRVFGNALDLSNGILPVIPVFLVAVTVEPLRRMIYGNIDRMFAGLDRRRREALQRLDLLTRSVSHVHEILIKTAKELSMLLPGYSVTFLSKQGADTGFSDVEMKVKMPASSAAYEFFTLKQEVLVINEVPYKIQKYSESELRQLEGSEGFFSNNSIKAVMPFGTGERLIAIILIISNSKRRVLFSDQIELLKRIHMITNTALVNAEMYLRALERAVTQASLD